MVNNGGNGLRRQCVQFVMKVLAVGLVVHVG